MVAPKFEQNADFRVWITGNPCETAPSSFWVILEIKLQLAFLLLPKKFLNPTSNLQASYASNSAYFLGSNSLTV